jgi:hypothetical protein
VIPEHLDRREVAHRGLTELHVVRSMHERKQMMASLADGFVVFPEGSARWRSSSRSGPGGSSDCTASRTVCSTWRATSTTC